MKLFSVLLFAAAALPVANAEFITTKWDTQRRENKRFCGTEAYSVSNNDITCHSYWLPAVRYDLLFINSALACAVCAYATAGAGCVSCASDQAGRWFAENAINYGGALQQMPSHVVDLAGTWLSNWWDSILEGNWYYNEINGWKISARGAVFTHCGKECSFWGCLPETCLQHQGLVQIKVERKARYIHVENECSKTVKVALRYKNANTDQWESECWYNLTPGRSTYLASGGDRLMTKNKIWYYYAESLDGQDVWSGYGSDGSVNRSCNGRSLNMKRMNYVDSDGDLTLRLTCNRGRALGDNSNITDAELFSTDEASLMNSGSIRGGITPNEGVSDEDLFWMAEYPQVEKHHDRDQNIEPFCVSEETGEDVDCKEKKTRWAAFVDLNAEHYESPMTFEDDVN